jgi:hypothetical protein
MPRRAFAFLGLDGCHTGRPSHANQPKMLGHPPSLLPFANFDKPEKNRLTGRRPAALLSGTDV